MIELSLLKLYQNDIDATLLQAQTLKRFEKRKIYSQGSKLFTLRTTPTLKSRNSFGDKYIFLRHLNISGPSCSKLTMSLVNILLKLIIKYGIYDNMFAEKNVSSFCSYSQFFSKNTCELDIVFTRTVNILTTNELVKLTML